GQALEGAQHQLSITHDIEAGPVEVRQHLEEQRRGVGGVGDGVCLAAQKGAELLAEFGIEFGLAAAGDGPCLKHGRSLLMLSNIAAENKASRGRLGTDFRNNPRKDLSKLRPN